MAITTEVIRRITVQGKTEGVDQATASLNKLAAAQDNVAKSGERTAVVTDLATKRQLSAAEAYRRQTLSLDETARAQDKIARATKVADDALRQGLITQAEHARRLTLITQKYMEGVGGSSAFSRALLVAND